MAVPLEDPEEVPVETNVDPLEPPVLNPPLLVLLPPQVVGPVPVGQQVPSQAQVMPEGHAAPVPQSNAPGL